MYEDLTAMSDPRRLHKVTEWLTHLKLKVEVNFLETRFVFLDKKTKLFYRYEFFHTIEGLYVEWRNTLKLNVDN